MRSCKGDRQTGGACAVAKAAFGKMVHPQKASHSKRRAGIERRPLQRWRQQLRGHGIRITHAFRGWIVDQCGRQTHDEEWAREGAGNGIQDGVEAFGRGEEYPDYIRAIAARAIGEGMK